jgi:hypothetical protein
VHLASLALQSASSLAILLKATHVGKSLSTVLPQMAVVHLSSAPSHAVTSAGFKFYVADGLESYLHFFALRVVISFF